MNLPAQRSELAPVKLWLGLSAALVAAGWGLSALHGINGWGYGALGLVGLGWLAYRRRAGRPPGGWCRWAIGTSGAGLRRRFRRFFPLAFLVLSLLAMLGGLLHSPSNHDALSYRVPRMLHWVSEQQWHWISTGNQRMNTRTCGFEFLTLPLLVATNTDRLFFLVNAASQLLLPGLIFWVFTALGVRRRVAWHWMWLLPSGYCFILQTGSIANDAFAAVYALAAVGYALRARASGRAADVGWSVLAAALLAGVKSSNVPLLLPWAVAVWPVLGLWWRSGWSMVGVLVLATVASPAPTYLLNYLHTRNWSGYGVEPAGFLASNPLLGVTGNAIILPLQNAIPPVFPLARWVSEKGPVLLGALYGKLETQFEPRFLYVGELQSEEWAGLGFGVCGLLLVTLAMAWAWRRRSGVLSAGGAAGAGWPKWVVLSAWVSLLAFMAKSGLAPAARLITPYYLLLAPALLRPAAHSRMVRQRWWPWAGGLVFGLALVALVVTPARPLWPAQTVIARLEPHLQGKRSFERLRLVYAIYAQRFDALAPVRALLPADLKVLGFVGARADLETSLWRPFGSRRLVDVLPDQRGEEIRRHGVEYVVVGSTGLEQLRTTMSEWAQAREAQVVGSVAVRTQASKEAETWYVARLQGGARKR